MRTLIVIALLLSIPSFALSAIIEVPKDYTTIQAAINAAMKGDTVLVAPGIYKENIAFNGKAITVKSSGGAGLTVSMEIRLGVLRRSQTMRDWILFWKDSL